ncbi:MAG: hypothetical protein ABJA82_03080 [Myxococcales bacterium]
MRNARRVFRISCWPAGIVLLAGMAGLGTTWPVGARTPVAPKGGPGHLPPEGELGFDVRDAPSSGPILTAYPFALTNPVFLDVDGDGRYRASLPHGHR